MAQSLARVLDDQYLDDLASIGIEELRARRAQCTAVETGLSYLRRLAQGRLDVVDAEVTVRAETGRTDELEELIARLPDLLAERTRSGGGPGGRMPAELDTGEIDRALADELDGIIEHAHLATPDELEDADLAVVRRALADFEHKVSELRRLLFDRLDAVEAELTRRYRTGEASVDSLLG